MKLLLARHPETEANRRGLVLGQGDSPPTAEGLSIFQRVMECVAREDIRRVVSSPLPRALTGARMAAEAMDCSLEIEPGLRELSCGEWEGFDRKSLDLPGDRLRRHWTDRPLGGESYQDAESRLGSVISNLDIFLKKGPVLVIGHVVVYRVLLKLWLTLSPEQAMKQHHLFQEVFIFSRQRFLKKISVGVE